ncbi:MAG: FK506 binding protein proline rotamase rapamycin-binding protein [Thelocarpon impressellum]|nr:MAG: FK506 binding protein proline rotamase rapamycin-binding protein [Thelocarpon impressellum]
MGVEKKVLRGGNGTDYPKKGDTITIEYTGFIFDPASSDTKGEKFDSSVGRGDFVTKIGVGEVIRGWDEGVTQMSLGEKARLTISSDYAYGDRGFPGHIPPGASLVFDVQLNGINDKKL